MVETTRAPKSRSLTATLALAFVALSLVAVLVAGGLQLYSYFLAQQAVVAGQQRLIAQDAANTVQSFMQERFGELEAAIRFGELSDASPATLEQSLEQLLGFEPAFRQLILMDAQEQVISRVSRLSQAASGEITNRLEAELFAQTEQGARYISPVYIDEVTFEPMVLMAVPVQNVFGDHQGSLVAEVNLKFMWDLVDRLEVGETGVAYVVDRQGNLLAYGDISRVLAGENLSHLEEIDEFVNQEDVLIEFEETNVDVSTGIEGDSVLSAYVPLGTPDWAVVTELPVAEGYQAVIRSIINAGAIVAVVAIVAAVVGIYLARRLAKPLLNLTEVAGQISAGEIGIQAEVGGPTEVAQLAQAFNSMTRQLRELIGSLEQRVADRTRALETSVEVSRRLSTILDQELLVHEVVEEIRSAFNYYHVHIYLYDDNRDNLLMVGGTGEAGTAMLDQGHYIPAGKGLVGRAATENEPVLIPDVTQNPDWLPNPLLPDTLAEAAVPIAVGDNVVGVLDVQQNAVNSLTEEDVSLLQSIASQVAIALQNASLFTQREEALASVQEEQERIQTILESFATPVVISSVADGTVLYVNEPLAEAIRMSRESLIGQGTPDFYDDPEDRDAFLSEIRQNGFVDDYELHLKRADGDTFWALVSARVINYQNETALLTSLVDIDERKETEVLLAKQANELATLAQVSTAAATLLEPQELLQQVVDLTKDRFNLYHAHIHLLDDSKDTLVLTVGAGDVGQQMVAEGRRIPLAAEGSLVASVARTGQGAIRNYETAGEGFMPHPLLAETRSEMAVAINLGDEILGVLDVRSDELGYFGEADMQVIDMLASQVAVALQNARLYQQSQKTLRELDILTNRLTHEGWEEYVDTAMPNRRYSFGLPSKDTEDGPDRQISLPLQVQGAAIGQLTLAKPPDMAEDVASIASEVADRLSTHIENLRLSYQTEQALSEAERRSEELALINRIVTNIAASLDLQHGMQTVVTGLVQALGVEQARIALLNDEGTELTIIAEQFDRNKSTSALGMKIPVTSNPLTKAVFETRQPIVIDDVPHDPRVEPVREMLMEQKIASLVLLPMLVGNDVLGTVGIDILEQGKTLTKDQIRLAETIIFQAATAIQNSRLFEQTQDALREVQETTAFLDSVIENLPTMLFVKEAEELRFVRWNKAGEKLVGFTREEMIGKNDYDFFQEEEARFFTEKDREVLESGTILDIPEETIETSHQGTRLLHTRKVPILDEQGQPKYLLGISEDVTEQKQAEAQLAKQAKELQTVAEISTAVASTLDQQQLLHDVVHLTKYKFDLYHAHIYLLNETGDTLVLAAGADQAGQKMVAERLQIPLQRDKSLVARAARRRQGIIVNDVQADPGFLPNPLLPDTRSEMAVPLIVSNQLLGVLDVQAAEVDRFTQQDINIHTTLASQIATALQNAIQYAQAQRRAEREALVNEISQKIQSTVSMEHALQTAVEELGQALQARYTQVSIKLDKEKTDLKEPAGQNKNGTNGSHNEPVG